MKPPQNSPNREGTWFSFTSVTPLTLCSRHALFPGRLFASSHLHQHLPPNAPSPHAFLPALTDVKQSHNIISDRESSPVP